MAAAKKHNRRDELTRMPKSFRAHGACSRLLPHLYNTIIRLGLGLGLGLGVYKKRDRRERWVRVRLATQTDEQEGEGE